MPSGPVQGALRKPQQRKPLKTLTQHVSASDKFGCQILCKIHSCSKTVSKTLLNLRLAKFTGILRSILSGLAEAMQRTLAPLRRIVARELEVLEFRRNSEIPQSFIIHDHLECGHVSACLSWDILDLLIAYTTNPEVSAKRHRCRPCASLLASRKPVQSVALAAKAGAA